MIPMILLEDNAATHQSGLCGREFGRGDNGAPHGAVPLGRRSRQDGSFHSLTWKRAACFGGRGGGLTVKPSISITSLSLYWVPESCYLKTNEYHLTVNWGWRIKDPLINLRKVLKPLNLHRKQTQNCVHLLSNATQWSNETQLRLTVAVS